MWLLTTLLALNRVQGGVERVFVDHPLFLSNDIYGGSTGGTKGVYTYSESWEVRLQYRAKRASAELRTGFNLAMSGPPSTNPNP